MYPCVAMQQCDSSIISVACGVGVVSCRCRTGQLTRLGTFSLGLPYIVLLLCRSSVSPPLVLPVFFCVLLLYFHIVLVFLLFLTFRFVSIQVKCCSLRVVAVFVPLMIWPFSSLISL